MIIRFRKYTESMNSSTTKMDTSVTGMWVSFFTAAGIPPDVSATYALTFSENRIQSDMLLDLNKEYLRDMGIVRMGDVIAILRHAKRVHESVARDRVLGASINKMPVVAVPVAAVPVAAVPVAAVTGRTTIAQPSCPAGRILEHYARNASGPVNTPVVYSTAAVKLKRQAAAHVGTTTDTTVKKSRVIRCDGRAGAAPPQEISNKQTVFSRLGNSEAAQAAASPKPATKQVYLRLGSKPDDKEKEQNVPLQRDALKYEGILKSSPPAAGSLVPLTKKVFTVTTNKNNQRKIAVATMRADETPVSVKEKLSLPKAKSVKFSNQIQYKEIEANKSATAPAKPKAAEQMFTPVFNKPERRLCMPEAEGAGVKARLGSKGDNNFTITRNVFNRLGV